MLTHQAAFVDHLITVVTEREVDLVVVSGDIYDRALPPVDAVALADEAFARLAASRARVVITSGNHDSAQRLGFNARLADAAGFHLRTHLDRVAEPVLLDDPDGPVAVYGIPYLEPDQAKRVWGLDNRSHHSALAEAMRKVRADLAHRPGTRSVVMAHAFVMGGLSSDSERDIAVGGVSAVPTAIFEGIDYVALGHLHGRHTLTESIRYSGSPLAYSFSEARHLKGSWLIDLAATGGVANAEFVPAPVGRGLAILRGTIEDLLHDPAHEAIENCWVQATLTDPIRPTQAMNRLQVRFPHLASLQFAPPQATLSRSTRRTSGRSDHEIALEFINEIRGLQATAAESDLLRDAAEACRLDPDGDLAVGSR